MVTIKSPLKKEPVLSEAEGGLRGCKTLIYLNQFKFKQPPNPLW